MAFGGNGGGDQRAARFPDTAHFASFKRAMLACDLYCALFHFVVYLTVLHHAALQALLRQYAPGIGSGIFLERAISRKASGVWHLFVWVAGRVLCDG
jgi:hypothetical protein